MSADVASAAGKPALAGEGVSVVIPCYNYGRYLRKAIDSVLLQTVAPLQIIVVDDGSTDDTAAIAGSYGLPVCCLSRPHEGVSAARNAGLAVATQPFVAFLDADDVWRPEMLVTCLRAFSSLPSDYCLVACRNILIDDDDREITYNARNDHVADGDITCGMLLMKSRFVCDSVVIRRAVLDKAGYFDVSLSCSEDRDLYLRLSLHGRIRLLPDRLVAVRRHAGSASTNAPAMVRQIRKVIRCNAARSNVGWVLRRRALSFCEYQGAWMYAGNGLPWGALGLLLASWYHWPWFIDAASLENPMLFRLRALRHILLALGRRRA